mgnify:FL=1
MPTLERRVADLERELQSLRAWTRSGAGSSTYGGATTTRPLQVGFPAKITSTYSAATGYNWSMRLLTPGTATTVDPTSTVSGNGAVEVSGRTDIASGTKVWMEPDPNGRGFLFTVSDTVSDTGGGLTVSEVDLAPSYTSITTVRFDQADGFVVSQPAAGIARIDQTPASVTTVGYVTTGAQTFTGDKTFFSAVTVNGDLTVDLNINNAAGTMYAGVIQSVGTIAANYNNATFAGASVFHVCDGFSDGLGTPINSIDISGNATYSTTADRWVKLWGGTAITTKPGELEINGVIQFAGISDANAPNSSLYYSTTANKLVYKDGGGTVQALW